MIVRRKGGLTEFIPSPQEKRDGLIRDHALGLLENLHQRLARLERASSCVVFWRSFIRRQNMKS